MFNKKIYDWWNSGVSYQSEVQAWLTQGTADGGTPPSASQLSALSTFIRSLDSAGLWSRCKTMNILHLGSKEFCKLNLKNVATYKYTESGTVTFSALNGCKSASSSYFNQGFKSDAFAGNQLTFISYVSESSTTDLLETTHGVRVNGSTNNIVATYPKRSTAAAHAHCYTVLGSPVSVASANHKGLFISTHDGTNGILHRDNVKTSAVITLGVANISNDRYVLARNSDTNNGGTLPIQYYTKYLALDAIWDQFSDTDASNFYTYWETYKTAVSLP